MSRKTPFENNEFYHIYNRGVDKRNIFSDFSDSERLFKNLIEFNRIEPIGSIHEQSFKNKNAKSKNEKLVNVIAYCLNPNHFHLILEQVADGGISEFMKRLGGGYAGYFNNKYKRSGALFQGRFKSIHINSNEYLLKLSAYVNLNDKVHKLSGSTAKFVRSSFDEYTSKYSKENFCEKDIILKQFNSKKDYKKFAYESLKHTLERRESMKDIFIE